MVKAPLSKHLAMQLDHVSMNFGVEAADDKDCILSQEFFCTPDYITPEMPAMPSNVDWHKDNIQCPKSPEKIQTFKSKRQRLGFNAGIGGDGLSRYRTDFHEIEKIGTGNFNHVFKVLKRIDGCMYAVKHSINKLHQDTERRKALMEVQALGALGYHENIVGYYSSWFENEHLYIQQELCEQSLSASKLSKLYTEAHALDAMYQIAKALQFIHGKGIAHLDIKPDNIYVKDGIYKLGDFGCATLIDKSLPVEEGDARYMPHEILNENYDNLDKVDIFSLGASIYELARGSPLPDSGSHFLNLREGKLPLLPGHSLQFQNLIKVMMDANPVRRPSAKEVVENPIFYRHQSKIWKKGIESQKE
ncbi:wee1-like protein kinase isoform X2 [Andrographis paniculata]|uniref:wee1-like protein kinase isoform X2 n=1 Tax=Andrographis paniculata TaxID=175694 RepID=UPI0021E82AF0|nr:wee1-like protein kinase isoform X2 [Andrographis paniculata]